jgi:hypothetical protein
VPDPLHLVEGPARRPQALRWCTDGAVARADEVR